MMTEFRWKRWSDSRYIYSSVNDCQCHQSIHCCRADSSTPCSPPLPQERFYNQTMPTLHSINFIFARRQFQIIGRWQFQRASIFAAGPPHAKFHSCHFDQSRHDVSCAKCALTNGLTGKHQRKTILRACDKGRPSLDQVPWKEHLWNTWQRQYG